MLAHPHPSLGGLGRKVVLYLAQAHSRVHSTLYEPFQRLVSSYRSSSSKDHIPT
jgi:hypothetical protein